MFAVTTVTPDLRARTLLKEERVELHDAAGAVLLRTFGPGPY